MNNEEQQQLKKEVEEIKKELNKLKSSSTIPFDVERAFEAKGFMKTVSVDSLDPTAYDTLNKDFGGIPGLDFPIRWMKISATLPGNTNFYIPVYTLTDL